MLKLFLKFSFGSWVSAVISFFTVPITTLLLMPEEFGKASMFTLAYIIVSQIVLFGSDQSFVRFFYEHEEKKRPNLLWNSIFPSILVWAILSVGLICCWKWVSNWLIEEHQILIVGLLSINLLIGLFNRYALLVVRMQKKGIFFSLMQIIASVINVVFIITYSKLVSGTFYAIVWAGICSSSIILLISVIKERDFWFSRLSISKIQMKTILRYGIPFLPVCLMAIFFESMDKMFLREFVGFEGLGLYTVAFKVVAVLTIIQVGFSMFWIPTSYEHYEKNPEDKTLYEKTFKYVLFILTFCGLGLIAIKDIIVLLFNKEYIETASIMPFLIFIPIMYALSEITYLGINFTKKTYWHIVIFAILLILCLLFNYVFVLWLGVKGAAIAIALSYTAYFFLRTYASIRLYPMNFNLGKTALTFLLLYIVAGINTFVADKIIGIACAAITILVYSLLHISTIKDMVVYFRKMMVDFKNRVT